MQVIRKAITWMHIEMSCGAPQQSQSSFSLRSAPLCNLRSPDRARNEQWLSSFRLYRPLTAYSLLIASLEVSYPVDKRADQGQFRGLECRSQVSIGSGKRGGLRSDAAEKNRQGCIFYLAYPNCRRGGNFYHHLPWR